MAKVLRPDSTQANVHRARIYSKWREKSIGRHSRSVLQLCLYVTLFMIGFDNLFVAKPEVFIEGRFVVLAILFLALYLQAQLKSKNRILNSFFLLLGPCTLHLQY